MSPFGAKGLRTVRDVGGIITAIASRQWPTNIAAAGQGIGQPFENARRIDAVGLRLIGDFIGSGVKRTPRGRRASADVTKYFKTWNGARRRADQAAIDWLSAAKASAST
jgi:hypothetical protein